MLLAKHGYFLRVIEFKKTRPSSAKKIQNNKTMLGNYLVV